MSSHPVILFLDFDGVLHHVFPREDRTDDQNAPFYYLPRLERVLRDFPQVRVVISSTWRRHKSLDELREYFSEDLRDRVVGVTAEGPEDRFRAVRQHLCLHWLEEHGLKNARWVALDDYRYHFYAEAPWVWCEDGFKDNEEHALRAMLKGEPARWVVYRLNVVTGQKQHLETTTFSEAKLRVSSSMDDWLHEAHALGRVPEDLAEEDAWLTLTCSEGDAPQDVIGGGADHKSGEELPVGSGEESDGQQLVNRSDL